MSFCVPPCVRVAMEQIRGQRRVQHPARRMRQLQELRTEQLLVTYDFGDALVALQLVVKAALDGLCVVQFARLARERVDRALAPRVEWALAPLCILWVCNLWVIAPERANAYVGTMVAQSRNRWQARGLVGRWQPSGRGCSRFRRGGHLKSRSSDPMCHDRA